MAGYPYVDKAVQLLFRLKRVGCCLYLWEGIYAHPMKFGLMSYLWPLRAALILGFAALLCLVDCVAFAQDAPCNFALNPMKTVKDNNLITERNAAETLMETYKDEKVIKYFLCRENKTFYYLFYIVDPNGEVLSRRISAMKF